MVHVRQFVKMNTTPLHPCAHCDKKFGSRESAWQHSVGVHSIMDEDELNMVVGKDKAIARGKSGYYPCSTCGQAVEDHAMGMEMHLETLKPALGLKLKCPSCDGEAGVFIETRALLQHFQFCRLKMREI